MCYVILLVDLMRLSLNTQATLSGLTGLRMIKGLIRNNHVLYIKIHVYGT